MKSRTIARIGLAIAALLLIPGSASAAIDQGVTAKRPWSGYWWPFLDRGNDLNLYDNGQALSKYDAYLKTTTGTAGGAQAWEKQNHYTTNPDYHWWGHCHAWAAASILAPEPNANFTKGGQNFTVNDTKGLVTSLYFRPTYAGLPGGTRSNSDDPNSAAYKDMAPVWFDYLMQYYVGYYKYPFVMDIAPDSQVWNFPAFAYRRSATPAGNGAQNVTTTVYYSNPVAGATGTQHFSRTYTYRLTAGGLGEWTGQSVTNHPDFAWVPIGKSAVPHVNEGVVEQILGQNV